MPFSLPDQRLELVLKKRYPKRQSGYKKYLIDWGNPKPINFGELTSLHTGSGELLIDCAAVTIGLLQQHPEKTNLTLLRLFCAGLAQANDILSSEVNPKDLFAILYGPLLQTYRPISFSFVGIEYAGLPISGTIAQRLESNEFQRLYDAIVAIPDHSGIDDLEDDVPPLSRCAGEGL